MISTSLGATSSSDALVGADQVSVCAAAAEAAARGNPAAAGLAASCNQLRGINVAAGDLFVDAMPVDASLRVYLTDTGNRIINGEPALRAIVAKLPADVARGFAIGIKVARARGGFNPAYAARVRAGMSAANAQGFDLATGAGGVKASGGGGGAGLSTTTMIGIGVLGLGALAAVAYKLRKRR